jgi:hypothetical protein
MELTIAPADLQAAAIELAGCSERLAAAEATFARQARTELPDIGTKSAAAIGRGIGGTEHAIEIIVTDIDRLARALTALAQHYPRVDATAVARR